MVAKAAIWMVAALVLAAVAALPALMAPARMVVLSPRRAMARAAVGVMDYLPAMAVTAA
jgi:hypothetical protein